MGVRVVSADAVRCGSLWAGRGAAADDCVASVRAADPDRDEVRAILAEVGGDGTLALRTVLAADHNLKIGH
jgi:hypothetical protein